MPQCLPAQRLAFAEEDPDALVDQGKAALQAKDYATALDLYTRAANAGNARSINNLGWLYQNGFGVEQSYEKAMEYWRCSADLGYAPAYEAVGELYRDGLGVEQDYETAADWFHKAVELGETDEGQINYDKLIEEGKIPADYIPKDIIF